MPSKDRLCFSYARPQERDQEGHTEPTGRGSSYISSQRPSLVVRLSIAKPLQFQIVERARALIADEHRWCRGVLAEDATGASVFPTSASAVKHCGLGAVIAAAYQLTPDFDAANEPTRPCVHITAQPRLPRSSRIIVAGIREREFTIGEEMGNLIEWQKISRRLAIQSDA